MKRYVFFLGLYMLAACTPLEDPLVTVEDPVFMIDGSVDGQPLFIQAGAEDYFMETGFSYDEAGGVLEFTGSLKKYGCMDCPQSLSISIRNYKTTGPGESADPDVAFKPGYYTLRTGSDCITRFTLEFTAQNWGSVASHHWSFGDGTAATTANPAHTYTHPGQYTVGYMAKYPNGCTDTIFNTFRVGIPEAVCRANFTPTIAGNTVSTVNFSTGFPPLSMHWNFGDGFTSEEYEPSHTYSQPGIYKILLLVNDGQNHFAEFSRKVIILPTADCLASMTYPDLSFEPNPDFLSTVAIDYIDATGTLFSSAFFPPADINFFKILAVEPYGDNPAGEKVKKLHLAFRCRLYNSSQSSFINLDVPEAVLGVAYP